MVPTSRLTAILTGPTASGKSEIAHTFAREHGGLELINGDSICVYQGFNIGSAKPSAKERSEVRYHLLDIHSPNQPFTAGDFVRGVAAALEDIHARNKRALLVGGTGFYLKALTHGLWGSEDPAGTLSPHPDLRATLDAQSNGALHSQLSARDPEAATRIGLHDRYRLLRAVEIMTLTGKTPSQHQAELEASHPEPRRDLSLFLIDRAPDDLQTRILARIRQMISEGLLEEVQGLLDSYPKSAALKAVGYAETIAFLKGTPPSGRKLRPGMDGLVDEIALATRQLVKRQRTFFRGRAFREGLALKEYLLDRDRDRLWKDLEIFYS